MAARAKERGLKPDRILSSPAVRAIATANIFARALSLAEHLVVRDERLYLASSSALFAVLRELGGDARHLMVVGHNPGLTEFADELSSERTVDNLPTCAIYTLQFDIRDWSDLVPAIGVNAEFDYPNKAY